MNRNIKIGVISVLAGTLVIASGLFMINANSKENNIKTEKYVNRVVNDEEEVQANDSLEKETTDEENLTKEDQVIENKNINVSNEVKDTSNEKDTQDAAVKNETVDSVIVEENPSTNSKEDEYIIGKEANDYVIGVIKANDGEHIKAQENKWSCTINFTVAGILKESNEQSIVLKNSWGKDLESYYLVNGYRSEDTSEEAIPYMIYLVGITSGEVLAMPNQGGLDVYEVKNNEVVRTYPYLEGESYKWR